MKKVFLRILLFLIIFTMLGLCNNAYAASDVFVESEQYMISETQLYIARILPRTTIQQFKERFNVPANIIHVYADDSLEEEVQSGYIATNMIVKFDGIEKNYRTCVVGDLNSDGLANQIEITQLIKHLVGFKDSELTGLELICADINNDDRVNQIDLTALINYVVYGRLNIGKTYKPEKPTIEVISGEKEGDGPYTSEVKVKITPQETENVLKTVYTISGSSQVAETDVPEDGQITISEDGLHIVRAYTYSTKGSRSEVAELVVKKSTKAIDDIGIGLILKLNNAEGEDYTSDTWTNQSIYVGTTQKTIQIEGGVEIKVNTTYTITGKATIATPKEDATILEDNGEYLVMAIAQDELGRTKTKTYKVKIDKEAPVSSTIEIEQEKKESGYYNTQIQAKVIFGTDALSQIDKVTYELTGDEIVEETEIDNNEKITITNDGQIKIIIRTYDVAGNVTILNEVVKIDKTAPTGLTLEAKNITGTSFYLDGTAQDNLSGIQKYEIYIDDSSVKTIKTFAGVIGVLCSDLETKQHTVKMKVTDKAENTNEISINVTNTKLENSEIDHIEFEINKFTISNKVVNDNENVEMIVSTTSLDKESKYMQISVNKNEELATTGELEGKIKIIRKDKVEVTDLNFFPEELIIEAKYSSEGNGENWKHTSIAEILGQKIHDTGDELSTKVENEVKSIRIGNVLQEENKFYISEKKTHGVSSLTRLAISQITLNGEKIPFSIVEKM